MTSTQHRQRQLQTKTINVNANLVGPIIGTQGETVIRLAKSAGKGCHIQHQRENPGTFVISARDTATLLRAEIKLKEHIKSLVAMEPSLFSRRVIRLKQNTPSNRFQSLHDENSYSTFQRKHRYRPRRNEGSETNRNNNNNKYVVRQPRYDNRGHLMVDNHTDSSNRGQLNTKPPSLLPESDYDAPTIQGAWSKLSDSVMSDRSLTPPPDKPLDTLKEGEMEIEKAGIKMNFSQIKRVEFMEESEITHRDDDAFSEHSDEQYEQYEQFEGGAGYDDWDDDELEFMDLQWDVER